MSALMALSAALDALWSNRLRSALTMLGIVIGVAAVIVMVAIGAGSQVQVAQQIERLGSNLITVSPGTATATGARLGAGSRMTLTEDDAAAIQDQIPAVEVAGVMWWGRGQAIRGNRNWSTRIHGIDPEFLVARNWDVGHGRALAHEDVDRAAKVALLGQTVAFMLFGDDNPVGETLRLRNVPFVVAGVLEGKGQSASGQDYDDVVYVPISTARRSMTTARTAESARPVSAISGRARFAGPGPAPDGDGGLARRRVINLNEFPVRGVDAIVVKARDAASVAVAEDEVARLLRQRHRLAPGAPDDFQVRNHAEIAEARKASAATLAAMLATIAAVSLVVGGIGIMNIMLVSVTERRQEIGLRMAVGARRRDILRQFLIEAVTLSLIGGAAGVMLGLAASSTVAHVVDVEPIVEPPAILIAFAFAGAVGVLFGWYPAHQAARLDPIVALRHE
ncbi:MAG: ABC transporter permease [Pseudomonadota bacterium]